MFDKLSQQNIRIIQDFIRPGESTLGPGESTFFSGESTLRSGETSSGEWAIGRNDRNSVPPCFWFHAGSNPNSKSLSISPKSTFGLSGSEKYNINLFVHFFVVCFNCHVVSWQAQVSQSSGPKNEEKEKLRRQKQGRRLQEINARRREEKVPRTRKHNSPFKDCYVKTKT